jgi:hypothetical protein
MPGGNANSREDETRRDYTMLGWNLGRSNGEKRRESHILTENANGNCTKWQEQMPRGNAKGWDEMRRDEKGWDGMRRDERRRDEMRWDETRRDEMRCDETRWDKKEWDGMRRDEMRWEVRTEPRTDATAKTERENGIFNGELGSNKHTKQVKKTGCIIFKKRTKQFKWLPTAGNLSRNWYQNCLYEMLLDGVAASLTLCPAFKLL